MLVDKLIHNGICDSVKVRNNVKHMLNIKIDKEIKRDDLHFKYFQIILL